MNTLAAQCLGLALLGAICAPAHAEQPCKFSSDRAANFTGTIKKVIISAREGSLKVTGGTGGVIAKGRACAANEDMLGNITLESRREGDVVYLTVAISSGGVKNMFSFHRYAALDLQITVPKTAQLNITDTSGDIELSDVGPAVIVDDSGDQLLKNINGNLDVTDESGELRVVSVVGNVRVEDDSGSVDIEDVRGDVKITFDNSGGIAVAKVTGDVEVVEDASGDITIREVDGDVIIGRDGSGDITVSEVSGKLTVKSDNSGEILHDRVRGSVRIPAKY